LNWNRLSKWIRQSHRWVSIAFAIAVITNFAGFALGKGGAAAGLGGSIRRCSRSPFSCSPGLYMFALPYVTKWRTGTRDEHLTRE
jgi:cellulose synthase/poly-beta-1,6-N-acetylglucosamine synthase-like glycosyltransferase